MSTTIMCKACQSAPPASEGICIVCIRDAQTEARAVEQARERTRLAKAEALRHWRPPWKPGRNVPRGHGTGTPREAQVRGSQ